MLKITRRGSAGVWQIVGTVAGARVRQSARTTDRRAAEAEAAYIEGRLRREAHYGAERETTFAEAALAYIEAKHKLGEPVCSPVYLDRIIERHGARTLASIGPGHVHDIAVDLHPSAGPATRNRHGIAPFMAVYNHAVKRKAAPPMVVARFAEATPETVSVDRAWIEAVRGGFDDVWGRAMVRVMFETGMRIGTALALTRSMLDAAACVIRVPGEWLKNDEPHEFVVTRDLMDELLALPAGYRTRLPMRGQTIRTYASGFTRRRDAARLFGWVEPIGYVKALKRACTAAGVAYVPPHQSGRHSFATEYIVEHRIDPVTVAALGGWKDVGMLMRRYPHAKHAQHRAIVERVSGPAGAVARKGKAARR